MIRAIRYPDELEDVINLWSECGLLENEASIARDEIATQQRRDPELFLVYDIDGKIVGTILGGWDGWRGWIYKLGVSTEHRRSGIATDLIQEIVARLTKLGARRIGAYAYSSNNASISLFQKCGFIRLDVATMRLRL